MNENATYILRYRESGEKPLVQKYHLLGEARGAVQRLITRALAQQTDLELRLLDLEHGTLILSLNYAPLGEECSPICEECGCTNDDPCPGGCTWGDDYPFTIGDVCSACASKRERYLVAP